MKKLLIFLLIAGVIFGTGYYITNYTKLYNRNFDEYPEYIPVYDDKDVDKTLIDKYWQEVLGGETKPYRIEEIAREDKDVKYVGVVTIADKEYVVPLSEVPIDMNVFSYTTVTDLNGKITCYVFFKEG